MLVQRVVAQQFQGQRLAGADVCFGEVGEGGGHKQVENRADAGEGGDFCNQLALMAKHAGARQFFGPFQRIAHFGRAHAEQVFALEAAGEQVGMVQHKGLRHAVDGAADGHAAQHGATLAGGLLRPEFVDVHHALQYVFHFAVVQQAKFHRVFQVQECIADVVCRFHQVRQGVAAPMVRGDFR